MTLIALPTAGAWRRAAAREAKAAERAAQAKAHEEARLAKSKFRSRFHLSDIEKSLVNEKGIATIRAHCEGFIRTRLAPAYPKGDGRQTPTRGHPVFVAQHAITAPCGGGDPWGSRNAERTERCEEAPREPSACCCSALACARRVRFPTGRDPPQGAVMRLPCEVVECAARGRDSRRAAAGDRRLSYGVDLTGDGVMMHDFKCRCCGAYCHINNQH